MSKVNPGKFDSNLVFDDSDSDNSARGWSSSKLKVLFDALLREVSGTSNLIVPFFETLGQSINSSDTTLEIEISPHAGILNGFDKAQVFLFDGQTNILTEDSTFTIDNGGGRSFVTVNYPTLLPNKSYTLKLEPGTVYNGVETNQLHTYVLNTEEVAVKPVFGAPVLTPVDGNHNTLSNISIPLTSTHGGRNLTGSFVSGNVTVSGGSITTGTPVFDSGSNVINIPVTPDTAVHNTQYDVDIAQDALADLGTGNDVDTQSFTTPDEVKPVFTGLSTDIGNNQSAHITKVYVDISDLAYLDLQSVTGNLSFSINGGIQVLDPSFTEDFGNTRIIFDLTHADFNPITTTDKLFEGTQYDIALGAGTLTDGTKSSDGANFSITTDNEKKPVLSNLVSDSSGKAYGITQLEIDVSGGPFLYNVGDPEFTVDFTELRINGAATNIDGGTGAITTEDNAGQLTKIIIPVKDIIGATEYTVTLPADKIVDGSQGNDILSIALTTETEVKPTFNFAGSTPADEDTVEFVGLSQVVILINSLSYSVLREVDLSGITLTSTNDGLLNITSRVMDVGNKTITLGFSTAVSELDTITAAIPQGSIADGLTLSDVSTGVYTFDTEARTPVLPTFDFSTSTPADEDATVSQQLSQILIPITSSHEIDTDQLTVDDAQVSVLATSGAGVGTDPKSGSATITGTNLVIPVSFINSTDYEVTLLTGTVSDGSQDSVATSAGDLNFTVETQLPAVVNRWSLVLPTNTASVSGTKFLDFGTRDTAENNDGITLSSLYSDSTSSSPIWWLKGYVPQASRRIWVFEVKADSASSIPAFGGSVDADKARALDSDLISLSNATSSINDSVFTGFDFDNSNVLNWSVTGNSALYLEFVEFDDEIDKVLAQEWSNDQDWSTHAGV